MDLKELHKDCSELFKAALFEESGRSNACKVYDKLVGDCIDRSDCIGENFNQLLHRIAEEWFDNYNPKENADYYFCNYILLLYLLVERVDQVFNVINKDGKSKIFNDYRCEQFPTLRRVKKWANFFKHPKEFLFTHWPQYYFAEKLPIINKDDVLINYEFIEKHYSSDKEKPTILENNNKVFVEIPNLKELTKAFCMEMNIFFEFICNNQLIADYLKKRSTIELIYEPSEDEESNPTSKKQ